METTLDNNVSWLMRKPSEQLTHQCTIDTIDIQILFHLPMTFGNQN